MAIARKQFRRITFMKRLSVLFVVICFVVGSIPVVSVAQLPGPATVVSGSFSFTAINFPAATRTRARGITDSGNIVGFYSDASGVRHGYLLSNGTFTTFDPPEAIETRAVSINNAGLIAGNFRDSSGVQHSFFLDGGVFTIFDFPGATA